MTLVIEKKRTSTPINGRRVGEFFTYTGRKTDIPHSTIRRGRRHDLPVPVSNEVPCIATQPQQNTDAAETSVTKTGQIVVLLSEVRSLVELVRPLCINAELSPVGAMPEKTKRKYTKRKEAPAVESVPLAERPILAFKQAPALYPKSEQAFRRLARQAEQYQKYPKAGLPSNGFEKCIVRPPGSRNVYLDAKQLALWWAGSGQGGAK